MDRLWEENEKMSVKSEILIYYAEGTKDKDRAETIVKALEGLTIEKALSMLNVCQTAIKQGVFRVD